MLSTIQISLNNTFHSFALLPPFGYPGFRSAELFRTVFKVDRTASQIISQNRPGRNARISMVRGRNVHQDRDRSRPAAVPALYEGKPGDLRDATPNQR